MPQPQSGILPEPSPCALFLIWRVRDVATNGRDVARIAAGIPALINKVGALDRRAKLLCNISFGPEFWDVISPRRRPAGFRPFKALSAGGRTAPKTDGDLLCHILSKRPDLNFELAQHIAVQLGDRVEVMDEVHGFRYLDSRDLIGFIDGTENPKGKDRALVALIGKEDRAFAGGSFVFTQRYVHNLKKWAEVPQSKQEGIIGRRKRDNRELSDSVKPASAHIARVVIEEAGEELEIVRHSFPYGTVSEAGLFFLAYTKTLDTTEKMLSRMMGTSGDGRYDHLMDYTRAVSGATFFAPSLPVLKSLAR